MIIFVQSYVAPTTMGADNEIYKRVLKKFPHEVFPLDFIGSTVRSLTLKESLKQAWGG